MPRPLSYLRAIDSPRLYFLPSRMRRIPWAILSLLMAALLPITAKPGKSAPKLPTPVAEPDDGQIYTAPIRHTTATTSPEDIGPAQKHFILASSLDDEVAKQTADGPPVPHEKIALDKKISVSLVHDIQDDDISNRTLDNHALDAEIKYLNWGAVTEEQLHARRGHYFTITWINRGPRDDFTTCLEYRQVKSKEVVRTLSQFVPRASGATRSYFGVVNQAYLAYGPVSSWRFTVLRGKTVVAETQSFIW